MTVYQKEKWKTKKRGVLRNQISYLANCASAITLRFARRNRVANGAIHGGRPQCTGHAVRGLLAKRPPLMPRGLTVHRE